MNSKNKTLLVKKNIHFLWVLIPIMLLTFSYSCEQDPSPLGSDLLPDSDKIRFRYDTSITFEGNILKNDNRIRTSYQSYYNIGEITDPYFGIMRGEFAGQFLPENYKDTVSHFNVDSVVLFIAIDSIYGIHPSNASFNIYELNTELEDSLFHSYYSDEDVSSFYSTGDLISTNYEASGDTLIKITLNNDFLNKLISVEDTVYRSSENFLERFKGIAIVPGAFDAPGGLYYISTANTEIHMIHDDTTFVFKFNEGNRFAEYTKDYSSSAAQTYLNNPESENDEFLFIQGINGISSKIAFTNIESWLKDDSAISILNAELLIPVFKDPNFELFFPPGNLNFFYYDSDSLAYGLTDNSSGFFDGAYYEEKSYYRFNISRHFLNILTKDVQDSCLNFSIVPKYIRQGNQEVPMPSFPHRVILKSAENIKLNVTYTKH